MEASKVEGARVWIACVWIKA